MIKVNCWNEYDPLKTVILGNVWETDRIPHIYEDQDQDSLVKIVEQTHQELNEIQLILEQHNVNVLRPKQPKHYMNYTNYAALHQTPLINMRDFHMAYGNMFFITFGGFTLRRGQNAWLEDIINQLVTDGNLVLSANEPNFEPIDQSLIADKNYPTRFQKTYREFYKNKNLYHTACILKYDQIAFTSFMSGSTVGEKWIKNWLGQQNIKIVYANPYGHIDGINSILNQKTILTSTGENNPVWKKHFENIIICPQASDYWDWADDKSIMKKVRNPTGWLYEMQGHFQEFNAEANSLSINSETVMLSFYDKEFYNLLKNTYGIHAIYAKWTNRHFWGGGLHCITCDIEREK
jgi:hypothetical protein